MNIPLPTDLVLRPGTRLFDALDAEVMERDMLFVVGLPGVGKSLMVQQAALLAGLQGRCVSLLRWDVARLAFDQAPAARKYAEIDNLTHAAIRLAVGEWLRPAIDRWYRQKSSNELLIGECPFVGSRFIELARREDDALEPLLASDATCFLIPVPTLDVRTEIEAVRWEELRRPRHAQERYNAPPNVLHDLMDEIHELSRRLGLPSDGATRGYAAQPYLSVYQHLLRFRLSLPLIVDEVLPVPQSAQVLPESCGELVPTANEAGTSLARVGRLGDLQMQRRVAAWWQV